jgi:hypothetical protein
MDFNSTIDLIIRELDEAREIIDDLKKYPGVPALQVELAKSKCKSAAEVIGILKNIRESIPEKSDKKEVHAHQEIPEKPLEKKNVPPVRQEIRTENPEVRPEPRIETDLIEEEPVKEKESFTGQQPKKPFVAPIIADSFSHLANRFNEQVGNRKDDDLSNIMNRKHLKSLTDAIGVNDRFYFIREIFNGNKETYTEAISKLEKAENLSDAKNIIMNYKSDKSENEAVKQLLDLVKRKFTIDE